MRPEGDNTGSGIKNQLGRPSLGEYEILVREAAQNTWDARVDGKNLTFHISLNRLGNHAPVWKKLLGTGTVPHGASELLQGLDSNSVILTVSDRGTAGLGGPIRSDRVNETGEDANFVQFMRNVGEGRDTELGGGTYGFGKGIYYRVSRVSAILVDSQNLEDGPTKRRLMGAALSDDFEDASGQRFTGRHWWGEINKEVPDPVLGDDAEQISAELGLPGFAGAETGSDIVVLLPDLTLEWDDKAEDTPMQEATLEELGDRIRSYIYWNLWSKFKTTQRPEGIEFSVSVNGEQLEMPSVGSIPVIREFSLALDNIVSRHGTEFMMATHKPNIVGEMATVVVVSSSIEDTSPAVSAIRFDMPFETPIRHIARMRQAHLVVDYVAKDAFPTPDIGYIGVFRSSAYADSYFADAEPPTHDDWAFGRLTGQALGAVRGANGFITKQTQELVNARSGAKSKMIQGLGRLANQLGTFVDSRGVGGRADAEEKRTHNASKRKSDSKPEFRTEGASKVVLSDGVAHFSLRLRVREISPETSLEARGWIVAAGGKYPIDFSHQDSDEDWFLGWFHQDSASPVTTKSVITASELVPGEWSIRCRHQPGLAIQLAVEKR